MTTRSMNQMSVREKIPDSWDRTRYYAKLSRLALTEIPRTAIGQVVDLFHIPSEGDERKQERSEIFCVKAWRYALEKEIGTIEFRQQIVDELSVIKYRRDLPEATLVREM